MGRLRVRPSALAALTVRAAWSGQEATLHWGDGSAPVTVSAAAGPRTHTYAAPGAYTVTVTRDGATEAAERIFVREGTAPAVTWAAGADNPLFIDVTFGDRPDDLVSRYLLEWGDGDTTTVAAPAGAVHSHGYRPGTYTLAVTDLNAHRTVIEQIEVTDREYDPDFTLERVGETLTARAALTRVVAAGKDILIDWGDYTQDTLPAAQVGDSIEHTYTVADAYLVQCVYTDGSTEGSSGFIDLTKRGKGAKPVSRLDWWAHPTQPLAVTAKWFGSGWHYTVHWGDGTSERVAWQDKPTPHTYAAPGTYTVTCVSDLHTEWTATVQVTVRESTSVGASFALVEPGSNRVRASLSRVADPVRYQIGWGDQTVTEHDSGDLEPVHEYAWGTPAPAITVLDVPARRLGRFTGPDIGPGPEAPIDGFFLEYVSASSDSRRFRLRGGGVPPGETLTWYPHHLSWYRDVTADEHGRISDEIDIPRGINPDFDHRWFSFGIVGTTIKRQYIPVHPNRAQQGLPDLTYQIDVDDPNSLIFSATPPMLGEHVIDFGDGQQTTVDVQTLPMRVPHRYTKTANITATVTLPDGRKATRQVRGYTPANPCFNVHYPGSVSVTWLFNGWPEHGCAAGGEWGSDEYSPVIINNGYHPPHQLHRPDNRDGWHVGWSYGVPVGTYTFKYTSTFRPTSSHPVTVTKARFNQHLSPPPIEEVKFDDPQAEVTAWFGDTVEWTGGYQGKFHVTNHTGAVVAWQIEFTLDGPARVREVWPEDITHFESLGSGRWRIWSEAQMDETTTVTARIEPPGTPRKWPDDIRGSIQQTPPPSGGTDQEGQ